MTAAAATGTQGAAPGWSAATGRPRAEDEQESAVASGRSVRAWAAVVAATVIFGWSGVALAARSLPAWPTSARPVDAVADAIAKFEKGFRSTEKRRKDAELRRAALAELGSFDCAAVAQALVESYSDVDEEVEASQLRKDEVDERIESMIRGQEFKDRKFADPAQKQSYEQLCTEARLLGDEITALHELQKALTARAEELESDGAIAWLVANVIGGKRLPLSLKLAVARTAGTRGDRMAPPLVQALAKATSAEELAVVLAAIAGCGREAEEAAPAAIRALKHEDPAVREQAAWALAHLTAPEAIEPLIARLEQESGRTQRRIGVALEILTGQQHGESPRAWRDWFTREGADYAAGKVPLSKGRSKLADALTAPADPKKGVYYYGIPQEGKSIVYVIDCSGSMRVSIKGGGGRGAGPPEDAGPDSRMEATKDALIEVLGKLTKDDRFNVVCFNDVVVPYLTTMVAGTGKEIQKAQAWVRALQPASTTNIHDAMQEAFKLAGRGAADKYYKSNVDTIFLLTDGSPTRPDNQPDSTERILDSVRRWNPTKHVVIHTIGIGKDLNVTFLQQIARENGGRFVQQ